MTTPENAPHQAPRVDDFELAGTPDAFDRLWTPHRLAYVSNKKPSAADGEAKCPFCLAPDKDDEESLIVARGKTCFVVLNLYPYNSGHLMVCPYRHVGEYVDLTPEEVAEFGLLTQIGITALKLSASASGFNIGMNQGKSGGAGIAAHLHQHVVPRWVGDMNFMPVIAQTKPMSKTLADTRKVLAEVWDEAEKTLMQAQADAQ